MCGVASPLTRRGSSTSGPPNGPNRVRTVVSRLGAGLVTLLLTSMVVFALTAGNKAATVVSLLLMGGFGFATVPALQMRVMTYAGSATTLASGANIAAFNVGNAIGAWLGGLAIGAGFGFVSPLWTGAGLTVAGLVLLVAGTWRPGATPAGGRRRSPQLSGRRA